MSYLLDALGYAGDSLAKPGRAVRGLLGGRPEELLATLPFSDSLGLTDQANQVTGHELLRQLGMDPGDDLGGTLAGVGMDIATDPLTYAGGALLRGLGVGRMGSKAGAGADSHIFDLVSPEERALFAKNEGLIDNAFPVPVRPEAPPVATASPLAAEMGPEGLDAWTHAAPNEMIPRVPDPANYAMHIGYGDSAFKGVPSDLAGEGNQLDAFKASLGGWDQTLDDLHRMSPEARGRFLGTEDFSEGGAAYRGAAPDLPPAAQRDAWQYEISRRLGDLEALPQLNSRLPDEILQGIGSQQEKFSPFLDWSPQSAASLTVKDLHNGALQPSQVPGLLAGDLAHLPLDPAELRRAAALAQRDEALGQVTGSLGYLTQHGTYPIADLPMHIGPAEHGFPHATAAELRSALLDALNPTGLINNGIEPGVAYGLLRKPPTDEYGTMVREALALLESLGVRPDPKHIARAAARELL